MVRRRSVRHESKRLGSAVLLGLVLAMVAVSPAQAQDDVPRLVMVTADTAAEIQLLGASYDVGYIGELNEAAVYITDAEEAELRSQGYRIGKTIEDRNTWLERRAEIAAADADVTLSREFAQKGISKQGVVRNGKRIVPTPGEITIMRAYTFTAKIEGAVPTGRFLYVEAHSKAHTQASGGPTLSLSYAGADGVFRPSSNFSTSQGQAQNNVGKVVDAGAYLYHRHLIALRGADANLAAADTTVRVASSTGASDTSSVIEWAGSGLPPRAPNFMKDFLTKYLDPTESYGRLDQLAAEFPEIAQMVPLPHDSVGYSRPAMAVMAGTTAPGGTPGTTNQAVQLFSKALGHQGGNLITAEFRNPGAASSPLSVSVNGMDITVSLATNSTGGLASTAAQVRDAINASEAASALVTAHTYGTSTGTGIAPVRARVQLSDFLAAPAHVQRGPFDMRVLRIGKQRDGSKVGVFIYCQQHAREWVTPITCVETAERLVRNYAIDPTTRDYVDNLDIFILPSVNPDGGHYSFYDFHGKRRNMANYCSATSTGGVISNRNNWGVDLNRNNTIGTLTDGFDGASTSCTNDEYAGPFEKSEPEIQNEHWIVDTFPNIKFAINIHTHGGYFMWAPGAYRVPGRITLPAPNIGIERYFFDVSETILSHIRSSRGTTVLPQRTGPIADVLYSAAGNSADDMWYRRGIFAYSFEAGAQRVSVNPTTGAVSRSDVGFQPCFGGPGTGGTFSTASCTTGGQPNSLVNEGHESALEFAEGNYGLLQGALEYSRDTTPPNVDIEYSAAQTSGEPINFRFNWINEAAVIHYTTDGSTPTMQSPTYENQGPRRRGQVLTLSALGAHTVKWIAVDVKGNVSPVESQRLLIAADDEEKDASATVPATLSLSLGAPATFGSFTPGVSKDYTASTTANVVSSAGDGALSVADQSSSNPGHLINGSFVMPQKLQASATSAGGVGSLLSEVGSSASPTQLLTYSGPVSNDSVTLNFKQTVGQADALRTGSYAKTLTFTLSTTNP